MAVLSHCFCCFSLRHGVLLLGWLQAIASVMSLSGVIVVESSDSRTEFHQLLVASFKTMYVLLGGSVIQTIAAIFLLYGVYRRKSAYVLEYVKLETLLHIASLIEFCIYLLLEHSSFTLKEMYIFMGFLAFNYGFSIYYLVAAYSYYQTMIMEERIPLIQA